MFDEPVTLSLLKVWNYAKTPGRGVRDFHLSIDDVMCVCVRVCMCACNDRSLCVYMYSCMYVYIRKRTDLCLYICIYVYIYSYIHVRIYIYIHTNIRGTKVYKGPTHVMCKGGGCQGPTHVMCKSGGCHKFIYTNKQYTHTYTQVLVYKVHVRKSGGNPKP